MVFLRGGVKNSLMYRVKCFVKVLQLIRYYICSANSWREFEVAFNRDV